MSKLQVTTIDLESTGNNRIEYVGSNTVNFVAGNNIFATSNGSVLSIGSNTVSPLIAGPSLSNRNKIINGNFDIWQRATSNNSVANGQFIADRWMTLRANTTANVARQSFTLGQTDVPNEPIYFYRTTTTSVANNNGYCLVTQRIESVRTLAGKNATVSFWAKSDSGRPMSVEMVQCFGTGGSPSADVNVTPQKITLSTSWQKFILTFAIPSISGKTLGSNNDDFLALHFWFDAGSTYNARTSTLGQQSGVFDIAKVQVEEGSVATPFEERPIGLEQSLCERYFQTGYFTAYFVTSTATSFNPDISFRIQYPAKFRAVPTLSRINVTDTNTTTTFQGQSIDGFNVQYQILADNTPTASYFDWVADAEL